MQVKSELILQCIRKDRKSQSELYQACYGFLMSICHRYTNSRDEAKALVNEGFLKILTSLESYKPETAFEPWCKRIMINTLIDNYRKNLKQKQTLQFIEPDKLMAFEQPLDLNEFENIVSGEQLEMFLSKVPEMSRKVFNLFAIDGYSHKEIAEMLKISEGTSKWHVSTAREKLKSLIVAFIESKKKVIV